MNNLLGPPKPPALRPPHSGQVIERQHYHGDYWRDLPSAVLVPLDPARIGVVLAIAMILAPAYHYLRLLFGAVGGGALAAAPVVGMAMALVLHAMTAASRGRRSLLPDNAELDNISLFVIPLLKLVPVTAIAFGPLAVLASTDAGLLGLGAGLLWAAITLGPTLLLTTLGYSPAATLRPDILNHIWSLAPRELATSVALFAALGAAGWLAAGWGGWLVIGPAGLGVAFAVGLALASAGASALGLFAFCHQEALVGEPTVEEVQEPLVRSHRPIPMAQTEDAHTNRIEEALKAEVMAMAQHQNPSKEDP